MNCNNFIKSITSKDFKLSQNATYELINSKELLLFECLCEKSEFIFPFIREKIIKNFVKLINKDKLDNTFEFAKIYSFDFEDLIVNSWLKFACEDLTDKILEIFENGSMEQKAYCAKYFSKINDYAALDILQKYALCDFEPLRANCALALFEFKDKKIVNDAKEIIENSNDEFKILNAVQFLIEYKDTDLIPYIVQNAYKSPFVCEILGDLKNYFSLEELKNKLNCDDLSKIFSVFIENYPENIGLDTLIQYEIFDFIKYLTNDKNYNQFIENILVIAKNKFQDCFDNEIYTFDLNKDNKNELENIVEILKECSFKLQNLNDELETYNINSARYKTALGVIKELKLLDYCNKIANLINSNTLDYSLLSYSAQILKDLNKQDLIKKEVIESIDNENIKNFILSLL